MDPNACWTEFEAALATDDFVAMREKGQALRDWIDRGGVWPTNCGKSQVYHHLRLQLDISTGHEWNPKNV